MLSLFAALILLAPEVPPECQAPPTREVSKLAGFAQSSGSLSVGLDSVATWCFDSGGTWTGGQQAAKGKKPSSSDPTGDCAKAIVACEAARASIAPEVRQLLYDSLADLERPFLGVKYKPKRSGLAERPPEAAECSARDRSTLFTHAQSRMDLARLASQVQSEYANYKTWLFSEGLKCAQAIARGEKDYTRRGIAVDTPTPGGGTQQVPNTNSLSPTGEKVGVRGNTSGTTNTTVAVDNGGTAAGANGATNSGNASVNGGTGNGGTTAGVNGGTGSSGMTAGVNGGSAGGGTTAGLNRGGTVSGGTTAGMNGAGGTTASVNGGTGTGGTTAGVNGGTGTGGTTAGGNGGTGSGGTTAGVNGGTGSGGTTAGVNGGTGSGGTTAGVNGGTGSGGTTAGVNGGTGSGGTTAVVNRSTGTGGTTSGGNGGTGTGGTTAGGNSGTGSGGTTPGVNGSTGTGGTTAGGNGGTGSGGTSAVVNRGTGNGGTAAGVSGTGSGGTSVAMNGGTGSSATTAGGTGNGGTTAGANGGTTPGVNSTPGTGTNAGGTGNGGATAGVNGSAAATGIPLGGPTAERERALNAGILVKWRYFLTEQNKLEQDNDWVGGFLASRELRDCRCVQRPIPSEIVRRLEQKDRVPQLEADDEKNTRCELCLLDAYPAWKVRAQKQCALALELSEFELGYLQRSDDGNGLPPRCVEAARAKQSGKPVAGIQVAPQGKGASGNSAFIITKAPDALPPTQGDFVKPSDYAPMPSREEGRVYVRVFTSAACVAEILPGPIQARTGDLLPVPTSARDVTVRGPCGGFVELYFGREEKPRVSDSFARNQPLRIQLRP